RPKEGEDCPGASREPFESRPPQFERRVVGHCRSDQRQECSAAPSFVGGPHESLVVLRSPSPWVVIGPRASCVGAEKDERTGPIRMGCCEQRRQPASLREAEERGALRT